MAQSKSNSAPSRGFTLAEVCVSIAVLTIGLVAAASMFGKVWGSTAYSEYMIEASTLVSEKLEDLNQFPNTDPNVAAGGSLSANTTAGGITYYDEVYLSASTGSVTETQVIGGNPYTITHQANGTIGTTNTAPTTANSIQFERRWVIEANPTVNGVTMTGMLRITVLVTLLNTSIKPQVTFQMSIVRP